MSARKIAPETTAARTAYSERVAGNHLHPLWEVFTRVLTPEPQVRARPAHWRYADTRPDLLESGDLISAAEAERRVLFLENPGLPGEVAVTESLYAGLQLVMPGESAPPHRHSPSALRLFIEGNRTYTAVNGEQAWMEPGDLVLTPAGCWHGHGNEGDQPAIWLDILDMPLVRNIGAVFLDTGNGAAPGERPPDDSLYRYGRNMRPTGGSGGEPDPLYSPVVRYPCAGTREALERIRASSKTDPCHGLKMEFTNPLTGGGALPTISTFIQLLPDGFTSQSYRSTEGSIFAVLDGRGSVIVGAGDKQVSFNWQARDLFVIPCWYPYRFCIEQETLLFSASDRAVQSRLGLWRERRGK